MMSALHTTPDPAMGGSTSEARAAAQESIRARILAMRQAKQAQIRAMQPESDEDGIAGLRAHETQVPAASLLSVPRSTARGRALVSDARLGGNAALHSWYAESDADDDAEDDEEVLADRRALFEAADEESTIHGHQPAPSQMRAPAARPRNVCSPPVDSGLSDYPLSSSTASRSDTSASARSSYAQPAEARFSRERASTLLDELAAELQAQRAYSPAPAAPAGRPPASPLPDVPGARSLGRSSTAGSSSGPKGLNSARSSLTSQSSDGAASGSRPRPAALANSSAKRSSTASGISTPLSPALSNRTSFNGGLSRQASSAGSLSRRASSIGPPSAPPPCIALPSLPPGSADRRISTASSATSAVSRWSVRSELPPTSEAGTVEPSGIAALPPQWVEELQEDSDEALSDVLNISPRDSPVPSRVALSSGQAQDDDDFDQGALSPPMSEDERRRQSLLRKSMGGLVAALANEAAGWKQESHAVVLPSRDSPVARGGKAEGTGSASDEGPAGALTEQSGASGTPERPLLTPEPYTRPGSGATAIVEMYQNSQASAPSSDSGRNADAQAPRGSERVGAAAAAPVVPAISIDEADSDTLSEGSSRGTPRKRRKQKKSKVGLAFDDQRVQAPGSSCRGQAGPTAAQEAAQWAYYAFSPDLPPFVPPGMRPTDLTGRGTWRSIAARAGTLDTMSSRGSTLTLGSIVSMDEQLGRQPSTSGPVSMRELAAQARAKAERANALRERQHTLLAQRSFLPIDIHTHAAEHALSERGSFVGSSASSVFSFDSSLRPRDSDLYSVASDETLGIRSAPVFPQPPARTESGAGTDAHPDADALVGLGIGPSARQAPTKQYVEFSMQTSPPSSRTSTPVASPVLGPSRVDMGVGVDGPEARRARRNANLLSASHALEGWRDNDSDAAAGGEARGSRPTQQPSRHDQVVRRSKSFGLAPRRAGSRSRFDALDLDSPGAWPPVLSAPRLSTRSSVATFDRSSARLSRAPSIASFTSGAISESTIGPESDAESDESDLDVAVSLDLLADRSGALDASPPRGEKRKHQQHHGASTIEALGERRIAAAPRKTGAPRHAARLHLARSSGWSSAESEDELPAGGRFADSGERARARPSAPAAFAAGSSTPQTTRTSASMRHAASAVDLRENARARVSHAAVSPLRAASPVLDLSFSDGDSLLHSDIEVSFESGDERSAIVV
jgi:hypothetical protein